MEERHKDFCNKIKYNTYRMLQDVSLYTTGMLSIGGYLLDNILLKILCISMAFVDGGVYVSSLLTQGEYENTYFINILKDYKEFLTRYDELNKTFNLNDPIEIYTLYNYLLYKGYLSKDKTFIFSDKEARDMDRLLPINVFTGQSVCRHIAPLLRDILVEHGIEAADLSVYAGDYALEMEILDEPIKTKEELIDWVRANFLDSEIPKYIEKINRFYEHHDDKYLNISFSKSDKKRAQFVSANHVLTCALKDGYSYYLDATQKAVLARDPIHKNLISNDCFEHLIKHPEYDDYYETGLKILEGDYPSLPLEERNRFIKETLKICDVNQDIFEKFYQDNKDYYSDTSNDLLSLRKKQKV